MVVELFAVTTAVRGALQSCTAWRWANLAVKVITVKVMEAVGSSVEFYLYPTVGTVLIHSVKPELTE